MLKARVWPGSFGKYDPQKEAMLMLTEQLHALLPEPLLSNSLVPSWQHNICWTSEHKPTCAPCHSLRLPLCAIIYTATDCAHLNPFTL